MCRSEQDVKLHIENQGRAQLARVQQSRAMEKSSREVVHKGHLDFCSVCPNEYGT